MTPVSRRQRTAFLFLLSVSAPVFAFNAYETASPIAATTITTLVGDESRKIEQKLDAMAEWAEKLDNNTTLLARDLSLYYQLSAGSHKTLQRILDSENKAVDLQSASIAAQIETAKRKKPKAAR